MSRPRILVICEYFCFICGGLRGEADVFVALLVLRLLFIILMLVWRLRRLRRSVWMLCRSRCMTRSMLMTMMLR